METTLYHFWRSSASWRVRWALAIKGIPFTSAIVDLAAGEHKGDAHRGRNPVGHVPALFIDGHWIAESVAILEYLEETRPEPALYPKDALGRARVRQLVELVVSGVQPLQNLTVLGKVSSEGPAQREWAAFFNARGLEAYERLLERFSAELPGRFSYGDRLTAADLCLVPQVYSARRFGVDLTPYPRVLAAEAAALSDPHASGALPENQPGAPAAR